MKRTKLTYFNSPVYLDEKNCLWFYKQSNGCNVETYILWEHAHHIKGDNLLKLFDNSNGELDKLRKQLDAISTKYGSKKNEICCLLPPEKFDRLTASKIICKDGKIQVNENYIKNIINQ